MQQGNVKLNLSLQFTSLILHQQCCSADCEVQSDSVELDMYEYTEILPE